MNNAVFVSTVGAKKKGLLPGGTGIILLLPLRVMLKRDTLAPFPAEIHFPLISRGTRGLPLQTYRSPLSAMALETDCLVTIPEGRGLDTISGGEIFHLLTSRAEILHSWTSEAGTYILGISGIEKDPPWTTGAAVGLLWITGVGSLLT